MKVKYLGAPSDPESIVLRQLRFPVNKVCIVRDASLARKIAAMPCFEVIDDEKAKADEPKEAPGKPEVDEGTVSDAEDAPVEDAEVE